MIKNLLLHGTSSAEVGSSAISSSGQHAKADGDERHAGAYHRRTRADTGVREWRHPDQPQGKIAMRSSRWSRLHTSWRCTKRHPASRPWSGHRPRANVSILGPTRLEVRHGLVEVVAGHADLLGQRFLRRGQQLVKLLGAEESFIVVAFKFDIGIGELRQRGTLMGDIHYCWRSEPLHLGTDRHTGFRLLIGSCETKPILLRATCRNPSACQPEISCRQACDGSSDHGLCPEADQAPPHSDVDLRPDSPTIATTDGVYAERGVANRMYRLAIISGKIDLEVLDFQQRTVGRCMASSLFSVFISVIEYPHLHSRPALRIKRILHGVTHHDEGKHSDGKLRGRVRTAPSDRYAEWTAH